MSISSGIDINYVKLRDLNRLQTYTVQCETRGGGGGERLAYFINCYAIVVFSLIYRLLRKRIKRQAIGVLEIEKELSK